MARCIEFELSSDWIGGTTTFSFFDLTKQSEVK